MTEAEARAWPGAHLGASERQQRTLERYAALLVEGNRGQNLISRASEAELWNRHLVDSAQLLLHVPRREGRWLDIGTGPGLPGLVVAILSDFAMALCEPRRRRAEFLSHCVETLGLGAQVSVHSCPAARLRMPPQDVISARAVADIDTLLAMGSHLSTGESLWLLPKGRHGREELAHSIHAAAFHVERSITDAASVIIVGSPGRVQ